MTMAPRSRTLTVSYRPLTEIRPARRNPKLHDLDAIRASLTRFGLGDVAGIVDDRDGRLVAGHGRVEALARMASEGDPPPLGVNVGPEGWEVPVLEGVRFRNRDEAEAFLLAHNRLVELGGWSQPVLDDMLPTLDLDATGFVLDAPKPGDTGEDDPKAITPPAKPISKVGSVWQLGPHRLVCGRSDTGDAWDLLVPPPADLVWTDPPYGVSYTAKVASSPGRSKTRATSEIAGDDLTPDQLEVLLRFSLARTLDRTRPGAAWFVAAPHGPLFLPFATVLTDLEVWRQTILWVKDRMVLGRSDYHGAHEPIFTGHTPGAPTPLYNEHDADTVLYGWTPGAAHTPPPDRRQTTVWDCPRPTASTEHPTMKPVDLIAADSLDRVAWCIELSPGYCDVIARRWSRYTGHTPIHNGTPTEVP